MKHSLLQYRRRLKLAASTRYENRLEKKMHYETTKPEQSYQLNPVDEIFTGDPIEKANEIQKRQKQYIQMIEGEEKPERRQKKPKKVKIKQKEASFKINKMKQNKKFKKQRKGKMKVNKHS